MVEEETTNMTHVLKALGGKLQGLFCFKNINFGVY
jgi:hypothetical protein